MRTTAELDLLEQIYTEMQELKRRKMLQDWADIVDSWGN